MALDMGTILLDKHLPTRPCLHDHWALGKPVCVIRVVLIAHVRVCQHPTPTPPTRPCARPPRSPTPPFCSARRGAVAGTLVAAAIPPLGGGGRRPRRVSAAARRPPCCGTWAAVVAAAGTARTPTTPTASLGWAAGARRPCPRVPPTPSAIGGRPAAASLVTAGDTGGGQRHCSRPHVADGVPRGGAPRAATACTAPRAGRARGGGGSGTE